MNDNNLNNNTKKVSPYKATTNLNTAIENPQINVGSATDINIQNSINNSVENNNSNNNLNNNLQFINNNQNLSSVNLENNSNTIQNVNTMVEKNNNITSEYRTTNINNNNVINNSNNYSYEPVMQEKKKRGDNPFSNIIHSKEFKTMVFIIFILLLFLLLMPYIYDFFRNLQMSFTA